MSRYRAGLIHLLISAAVVALALGAALLVWYPPPLFDAAGADRLLLILAGVDVTLGPLLTTLIFRSGKRGLRFDLTVIGLVQVAALAYGGWTMFLARPAYLVFAVDRFDVVTAADIPAEEQAKATRPEFRSSPLAGYRLVAARKPADRQEFERVTFAAMFAGHDLSHFPQHYTDYDGEMARAALARAKTLEDLRSGNPAAAAALAAWLDREGMQASALKFLPVKAAKRDLAAALERDSGRLVRLAPVPIW
jgi:hypothetical protein